MKFLNKKEQVIDLEITPYGENLLAKGRFKPEYYAFFDDEILYDSQYGGITEAQNSASVRIVEAHEIEMQTFLYGAETQVHAATEYYRLTENEKTLAQQYGRIPTDINNTPYVSDDSVTIATIPDKGTFGIPLGTTDLNSSKAPAWSINMLKGTLSSSAAYWNYPSGSHKPLSIPQLNMDYVNYELQLSSEISSQNYFDGWVLNSNSPVTGAVLNIIEDSIVLEIDEYNTDFDWENFEVEVFEVHTQEYDKVATPSSPATKWKKEYLVPLYFKKQKSQVQGNILLEPDEIIAQENTYIDSNYVEYYFDIFADNEIDQKLLCSLKPADKSQGIFSSRLLECNELENQKKIGIDNLYDTVDEEVCD